MISKHTYLALCLAGTMAVCADPVENLKDYQTLSKTAAGKNLLVNPSFDDHSDGGSKKKGWFLNPKEAKICPEGGYSQQGVLLTRTDPSVYTVSWQTVRNLKPNTRYILGCKMRVRKSDGRTSAVFGVEGGVTKYQAYAGNYDWTDRKIEFTTSDKKDAPYNILLFYRKGRTGEASFDDFYLREAGGEYFAGILNGYNRIQGSDRNIVFTATQLGDVVYAQTKTPEIRALVSICKAKGNRELLSVSEAVKDGRFTVDGSTLPKGECLVSVTVYDRANKVVLGKIKDLRLKVGEPESKPPKGAVTLDKYGRTLVDGKPFMPIGLYVGGLGRMYDIRYFADSPFNCVLPYSGYMAYMSACPDKGAKGIRVTLDMLHKHGLKMIFGVPFIYPGYDKGLTNQKPFWGGKDLSRDQFLTNVVDAVKDHPAMLAWYITDELPPPRYKELIHVRNLINRRDPFHPTCGVFFQIHELPAYSAAVDIPNIDFYPIAGKGPQNQKLISESTKMTRRVWARPDTGGMAFWATPQFFSWGGDNPDKNPKYHFPTEQEHRAMALLSAIGGAKGFVYYYYHCMLYGVGKTLDEKFQRFMPLWKDACSVARDLKELEPFIMSIRKAPKVTVRNIKGITHARAFVDEAYGRIRVLVASEGPGETEAEITIEENGPKGPQGELRSRFGKTQRKSRNVYLFKGKDVDCDILQRWPEYELDKDARDMVKKR